MQILRVCSSHHTRHSFCSVLEAARISRESKVEREARLAAAASRKLRKVSGWNLFQREKMENSQFPKEAYKKEVQKLAKAWKSLRKDDRVAYRAQAEIEFLQRENARNTPLPPAADSQQRLADIHDIGVKAAGKISSARLVKNYDLANAHELWKQPTQLADRNSAWPVP